MATDSTNVPQGELNFDAGSDMAGNELEFGAVQLAQVTADAGQPVQLPQGQQVVLVPVQPGQTLTLPTAETTGLLAKIGPEGNLSIVVDGRTIIFQGYVRANEESPVRIVTTDGDVIDVADVVAATDPNLDIQTAAGPAAGGQGDTVGNGIYTPFVAGPPLGGLDAIGVLDPTALQYRLIDDERRLFTRLEEDASPDFQITFDLLGGIVNEDDLKGTVIEFPQDQKAAFLMPESGSGDFGQGNDPFDTKDHEDEDPADNDGVDDNGLGVDDDREPLTTVATVTVDFHGEGPGTLVIDTSLLPTGLKSEGEDIVYEVIPAGGGVGTLIIGFVDENGDNHFDEADGDRKVFDAQVDKDVSDSVFKIAFTLYDNIDNAAPDANGDGRADLLSGDEQILGLPVNFTITDNNGSAVVGQLPLGVEDDIPFFGETQLTEGSGGILLTIENTDASITHDESWFPQGDADDQSIFNPQASGAAFDAGVKVVGAGFSLPYGDSVGAIFGIAQSKVAASFGADQSSREDDKLDNDPTARNSIFGELEDRTDADGDGLDDGENEQPFELFMIEQGKGSTPTEDNLLTPGNEGNLTIEDQLTNATVSWNGEELQVWVHQIDAQTIVGYVNVESDLPEQAAAFFKDEDTGKEAVFVLTIDDEGNLTFVQYHQINHLPNGDPSSHDEDFQILGEDGTPIIQVRISDYDGDHATQPVNLVIQDDGPKVVCDFDCVTEGDVEGEPNTAIGNVVTGANWTVFGSDANFLDGNKDFPGVDKPHTISKIGHDGVTYFLNTPDVGDPFVTKGAPFGEPGSEPLNGTTETFDPATGILHIPTEKGGTFDIVLISDSLHQVGDYKYTVPESAEHEHGGDKHVGPESTAESRSAAFDTVGEWVSTFNAGGITLEAQINGVTVPGSLGVKNVNVAGPDDYRGIGVDVPGDFADEEVDTQGPQSLKMTLQPGEFGAGTDNAKLTLGALFDGQQHDDGYQEIVLWQVFNNGVLVASGQILGDFDGLVTLDIDTNGALFNEIVLTPLSNGSFDDIRDNSDFVLVNFETCCPTDKFIEEFDYTLRDVDGDEASTTLKIGVEDTEPSIPYTSGSGNEVHVDEDGLPAGIGDNGSKYDDPATAASASGFISFTPGADPVTIELSVGNGGDTGLKTLDDQRVFAAWDAESNTLVGYIEGTNPLDPANQVFKVVITDAQSGAFDFFLLQPLQHSDTDVEDGDNTENLQDLVLDINVQIEDQDCDVAHTTLKVVIDDDMPLADLIAITVGGDGKLVHDETPGVQNNGNTPGDPGASGEDEDDVAGPLAAFGGLETAETLSAIGYASTTIALDLSGGTANVDKAYGADGPGHAELALTKSDGSPFEGDLTNLTSNGESIFLFTEDGLVVGRIGAGGVADENGDVVFALSLNSGTGAFDLAQYLPIDQPDPNASDEAITLLSGDDAGGALVYATATVTDADGDTVTKSIPMDGEEGNPSIQFQDHLEFVDLQPVAYDDKVCTVEPQKNANIMLVFDRSGSMNDPSGIPGLTKLQAAKEAAKNMLGEYAALGGDIRVMLVWFNDSAGRENAWLSVSEALLAIDAIGPSNNNALTSYQDAITTAISGFNDTDGRGDTATHPGVVYFLSDGQPTVDGGPGNAILPGTLTTWNTLLENDANNVDHVYAVGFGDGIPDGAANVHLNSVANPDNDAAPGDPNGTVLFVSNLADLEATLVDTIGAEVSGNILNGTIEDDPDGTAGQDPDYEGNAPAHISSFAYTGAGPNAITITWAGVSGGVNVLIAGTNVSFDTDHGRMTFHLATGDFTFVPDVIAGGDKHEVFTYFITDSDGDVSNSAKLDICITDLAPIAPVVVPQTQDPSGFLTSGEDSENDNPWQGSNGTNSNQRDNVDLGDGNDVGNARAGNDHVEGGDGDDTLDGGSGNDYLEGDDDNDTLSGGTGNDLLQGENGNDTLNGDAGNDLLEGGNGIDTLNGGEGNDELFGGDGADTMNGGAGNDYLHGEADGDLDKLFGGDGDDWLDVDSSDLGAGRQIDGGAGNDVLDISGFDLTGSAGITNIEVINMEGAGTQDDVTLTAADVIAMTDENNTLFIWGSGNGGNDDDLHLLTSDNWVLASDNMPSNGRTYDVYHSGNATIAVDIDVDVNFS